MNNNELYRVYNTCIYSIGVKFQDGRQYNIRPGSFILLNANDIAMIENESQRDKFISSGKLVPKNERDEKVDIMELFRIQNNDSEQVHYSVEEIKQKLGQSIKKVEAWLDTIEDEAELCAVWQTAKSMDLPASKLKMLDTKIPNREWLS